MKFGDKSKQCHSDLQVQTNTGSFKGAVMRII